MTRKDRVSQAKPLRVALAGAVAFVLVLLFAAGAKGFGDLDSVRQRETVLEQRIDRARSEIERLRYRLVLLREDPMTLERLAREELGMVRPNDVVIVLPPDDAAGSK